MRNPDFRYSILIFPSPALESAGQETNIAKRTQDRIKGPESNKMKESDANLARLFI